MRISNSMQPVSGSASVWRHWSGGLSGVGGKLPNVAALQAEYAALGEQKEKLYADYGRLKKQVKEYDVIKRNIDSILRRESEPERGKENVRG